VTEIVTRAKERLQPSAQVVATRALQGFTRARAATVRPGDVLSPSFVVIGAQRCGTTSLYKYLIQHPRVVRALTKEVHYFDLHFDRGERWYHAHFASPGLARVIKRRRRSDVVTGEASPYYFFHPFAPERLRANNAEAKLILLLRDPVARAKSHHRHEVALGVETLDFADAIAAEHDRLEGEYERMCADPSYVSFNHQHFSYVARGMYLEQLLRWHELFPAEQMLILNSDRFFADPEAAHLEVLEFLGLEAQSLPRYKSHNTYSRRGSDDATTRALTEWFTEPNAALYRYLGTDFGWGRAT
jgi:hypothetical protein